MRNSLHDVFMNKFSYAKEHKFFILLYCLIILPTFFMSMLSKYADCVAYTQWSINIWDALFSGRIREYFLVSAERLSGYPVGNPFGVLYLLPWAIWNFPVWISRLISHNDSVATILCLTWSKLFMIICSHIITLYCTKIIRFFTNNNTKDYAFQFIYILGCGTMFVSIAFFGQDEVCYMATLTAGIYYILIDRKKLGYFFLGFSVMLCNIMLVPVLAILLIQEKNLMKILALVICFLLPEKIVSVFCGINHLPEIAQSYNVASNFPLTELFDWFFGKSILHFGDFSISVFMVSLIVLYAFFYITKYEDDNHRNYCMILSPALTFLSMNIFSWQHCYRWFTYFPLLAVLIFIKGSKNKNLTVGLIFLTIFEYARIGMMITLDYCFRFKDLRFSFINKFSGNIDNRNFYSLFYDILPQEFFNIYNTIDCSVCISCVVLILIFIFKNNWKIKFNLSRNVLILIHTLLPLMLTVSISTLPFILYKLFPHPILINDISYNEKTLSYDLTKGTKIGTEFYLKKATVMKEFRFRCYTWGKQYESANLIGAIYKKNEVDMPLKQFSIPLTMVKDNVITSYNLDNYELPVGEYFIEFKVDHNLQSPFVIAANPKTDRFLLYDEKKIENMALCIEFFGR